MPSIAQMAEQLHKERAAIAAIFDAAKQEDGTFNLSAEEVGALHKRGEDLTALQKQHDDAVALEGMHRDVKGALGSGQRTVPGEAMASAEIMHMRLESKYTFASRWDDPAYVGKGDTYISLANPGNAATCQIMFAQYMRGTRIEGTSSNQGDLVAGNFSLYGSWWLINEPWWGLTDRSWQPARPMDMMDAMRQFRTDYDFAPWAEVQEIAARGGLLRVYNHEGNDPMTSDARRLVSWIVNPKGSDTFENWKTTDGEAASYVYARHTTSVSLNSSLEMGYDISRKDPKAAGYWLVPVTISIDLGGRQVLSVDVNERSGHGN